MSTCRYITGDVFDGLAHLAAEGTTVDLVMTSPPFLALRSYLPEDHPDKGKEIGSEPTPAAFLSTLLDVTEACAADRDNGTVRTTTSDPVTYPARARSGWPLDKSLTLIPSLYAASLAYGRNLLDPERTTDPWRIRNVVAWVRPNPPVGALGDKVRPATSYLTWATRSRTRYFDLDAVRTAPTSGEPGEARSGGAGGYRGITQRGSRLGAVTVSHPAGAPPLDWWSISPGGYSGSHYAVYPAELCRIPIEASCPRRVCRTCGKPSRRMVGDAEYVNTRTGQPAHMKPDGWRHGGGKVGGDRVNQSGPSGRSQTATRTTTTTGWTTCGCPGTEPNRLDGYHTDTGWRPGIVLDPFGGSGTTGLAATGLSRDAILIDIDERNAGLARERLGMFVTLDHLPTCPPGMSVAPAAEVLPVVGAHSSAGATSLPEPAPGRLPAHTAETPADVPTTEEATALFSQPVA